MLIFIFNFSYTSTSLSVLDKYAEQLIAEGVVTADEVKDVKDKYVKICEDAYSQAKQETHIKYKDWLDSPWSGFFEGKDPLKVSELLYILAYDSLI